MCFFLNRKNSLQMKISKFIFFCLAAVTAVGVHMCPGRRMLQIILKQMEHGAMQDASYNSRYICQVTPQLSLYLFTFTQ